MDTEAKARKSRELIELMEKERGFSRLWRKLLAERDPEFMELFHKAAMHVFRDGALPRKTKELICICADAFQFYEPGVRIHTRNALALGATEDEIIEALETAIMPGIHYLSALLPAIVEEVDSHQKGGKREEIYRDGQGH
ncbi:MAG: carboxymuconolactone decarboxylase family protein [Chloroflexi bacterium]|nr:carboxymuconolactone decarboxylase family protein [Chloroflexota bacterium]